MSGSCCLDVEGYSYEEEETLVSRLHKSRSPTPPSLAAAGHLCLISSSSWLFAPDCLEKLFFGFFFWSGCQEDWVAGHWASWCSTHSIAFPPPHWGPILTFSTVKPSFLGLKNSKITFLEFLTHIWAIFIILTVKPSFKNSKSLSEMTFLS